MRKINVFPKNREGWIRIVEAFVAVLLIAGFILVILDKGYLEKKDASEKIYEIENSILREIQLNDTLRNDILIAGPLPVNWTYINISIKNKIENEIPIYLNCTAKICSISDDCLLEFGFEKNIYVRSVAITTNSINYNPRQLKLFCWVK